MQALLRIIAAIAAVSVVATLVLMAILIGRAGLRPFLVASPLGILTLIGWAITLALGPFAAAQLWRHRESGRIAGLILFGFGAAYYLAGFFWLRAPEAESGQIIAAIIAYAIPVLILASPPARRACS
jgi:apolipoprotein N-acyltransferase